MTDTPNCEITAPSKYCPCTVTNPYNFRNLIQTGCNTPTDLQYLKCGRFQGDVYSYGLPIYSTNWTDDVTVRIFNYTAHALNVISSFKHGKCRQDGGMPPCSVTIDPYNAYAFNADGYALFDNAVDLGVLISYESDITKMTMVHITTDSDGKATATADPIGTLLVETYAKQSLINCPKDIGGYDNISGMVHLVVRGPKDLIVPDGDPQLNCVDGKYQICLPPRCNRYDAETGKIVCASEADGFSDCLDVTEDAKGTGKCTVHNGPEGMDVCNPELGVDPKCDISKVLCPQFDGKAYRCAKIPNDMEKSYEVCKFPGPGGCATSPPAPATKNWYRIFPSGFPNGCHLTDPSVPGPFSSLEDCNKGTQETTYQCTDHTCVPTNNLPVGVNSYQGYHSCFEKCT